MTFQPRTTDEVYENLEDNLRGKIERLTNFTRRSFNYIFTRAFAREVRATEVRTLASEMSGFIDYVGGPIDEGDLQELGVENVNPSEVNQYMDDEFLDEYVKIVGIRRFEGSRSAGTVEIETQDRQTTIPEGTVVTTTVDSDGDVTSFETTEQVETANGTEVVKNVDIQAIESGQQSNVPADTIQRFEDPPIGVKSVTNPDPTTGGEDRESNDELRARAKNAVQSASEGGTTNGIKGFIRKNIEGVGEGDIIIDEFVEEQPPSVDVVVDGGLDSEVRDAIETSRPTGMRHDLVRPEIVQLGFNINVRGTGINTDILEDEITEFLLDLGISENFFEDRFIKAVMNADNDIINIDDLGGIIERVTNEQFTYDSTQTDYELDYVYEDNGNISVTDETGTTYAEGVDFSVVDKTGDGFQETIVWDTSNITPIDGEKFNVDYDVTVNKDEDSDTFSYTTSQTDYTLSYSYDTSGEVSVSDNSGDTYVQGRDFSIQDKNGDTFPETLVWDTNESTPNDGEKFTVTYTVSPSSKTDPNNLYQTSLNRDEKFVWTQNYVEEEDFESTQDIYKLDYVPFPTSIDTITDNDGITYNKGTDYELADDTGNGFKQSIDWTIGGSKPADNVVFTAEYDRKVYQTDEDIIESTEDIIRDQSGDTYNEGNEYEIVSYQKQSNRADAIEWTTNPSSIVDGDEFYFTYITDGDIEFGKREKATVGTIDITVV